MNNQELLEFAAKARGLEADKSPYNGGGKNNTGFDVIGNLVLDWHDGVVWNPLTNIADCAEMEAHLEIDVSWFKDRVECCTYRFLAKEHYSNHPTKQSARMLASTRVAAEIGRSI